MSFLSLINVPLDSRWIVIPGEAAMTHTPNIKTLKFIPRPTITSFVLKRIARIFSVCHAKSWYRLIKSEKTWCDTSIGCRRTARLLLSGPLFRGWPSYHIPTAIRCWLESVSSAVNLFHREQSMETSR